MMRHRTPTTNKNPIEIYMRARRIIFAQMLKNPAIAHQWLDTKYWSRVTAIE